MKPIPLTKLVTVLAALAITGCSSIQSFTQFDLFKPDETTSQEPAQKDTHQLTIHHLRERFNIPAHPTAAWFKTKLPEYKKQSEKIFASEEDRLIYAHVIRLHSQFLAAQKKQHQTHMSLSVSHEDLGRGGAAIRQPDYIHVLLPSKSKGDKKTTTSEVLSNVTPANVAPHPVTDTEKQVNKKQIKPAPAPRHPSDSAHKIEQKQGFSIYELSRWERYCNNGIGMDEKDWRFVEKNQKRPPKFMKCTPPEYDLDDYFSAWTRFCEAKPITSTDKQIIKSTSRPTTKANPCKALQ